MLDPNDLQPELQTEYPLIDNDPHLFRALRYMRLWPDVAWIIGGTIGTPIMYTLLDRIAPAPHRPWRFTFTNGLAARILRMNMFIGFCGGFLVAYQNTCKRLLGVTENTREYTMDIDEMREKIRKNEPLYGKSELSEAVQRSAARNSRYSAFLSYAIPWFNLVNHPYHGVAESRYKDKEA